MRRVIGLAAVITTLALALAACGSSNKSPLSSGSAKPSSGTVVIGSANFPENVILADIYADALKAHGVKVSTHVNIGSRELYYKLIKSGQIDVVPEYNGALLGYLSPSSTAASTTAVDAALTKILPSTLEILSPSAAQDNDSVTVTAATAKKDHLTSIASLKPYASKFVFGGPPEFQTREQGLIGLKKLYGLTFKSFLTLDESGPLTIKALQEGKVQAANVFTTDPAIQIDHLVTLTDPKNVFPVQNVLPLIYKKAASSTVVKVLDEVSAKLTTATLVQLNNVVTNQHLDPGTVAAGYVAHVGLS